METIQRYVPSDIARVDQPSVRRGRYEIEITNPEAVRATVRVTVDQPTDIGWANVGDDGRSCVNWDKPGAIANGAKTVDVLVGDDGKRYVAVHVFMPDPQATTRLVVDVEELFSNLDVATSEGPGVPATGFTTAEVARLRVLIEAFGGYAFLGEFGGADDDERAAKMWAEVKPRSLSGGYQKTAKLMPRRMDFNKSWQWFNTMRVEGPFGAGPLMSLESEGARGLNHVIRLGSQIGKGERSFITAGLTPAADVKHAVISGVAIEGTGTQQIFDFGNARSLYSGVVEDLTVVNVAHVFGSPTRPFRATGLNITGEGNWHGVTDTAVTLVGSDIRFEAWINMDLRTDSKGKFQMILNTDKTIIGPRLFFTSYRYWRVLHITSGCNETRVLGCEFEGQNDSDAAAFGMIALIEGDVIFFGTAFNQGMREPDWLVKQGLATSPDQGTLVQRGGRAHYLGIGHKPTQGAPVQSPLTHPFAYIERGRAEFRHVEGWAGFRPTIVRRDSADANVVFDDSVDVWIRRSDGSHVRQAA